MFKTAIFDCAIHKKCCTIDGGRGIGPLFSPPPRGIWQLKSPHPGQKKMLMPGGQPGGGREGAGCRWNCLTHYLSLWVFHIVVILLVLFLFRLSWTSLSHICLIKFRPSRYLKRKTFHLIIYLSSFFIQICFRLSTDKFIPPPWYSGWNPFPEFLICCSISKWFNF